MTALDPPSEAPGAASPGGEDRRALRALRAVLAGWGPPALVAALPVLVATARALLRGWIPMGDNAYFSIRARDVLTEHHPLVGAWSSGSVAVGVNVNNLGPLQLDVLALPVRADWQIGTALGVAATNIAAIVLAVWVARRVAGRTAAIVCAAGAAGTSLALGSELLYEPRQHHALVLPFFCFLVLVWALASRWLWALPWTAAVASFLLQTHFTYAVPVALLSVAGGAAWLLAARGERSTGRALWPVLAATAAALVLAWAQPVIEQLTAEERGNLAAAVEAGRAADDVVGAVRGLRATADVLALPPWWLPSSFADFDPAAGLPSLPAALGGMLVLVTLLAGVAALAHREGDQVALGAVCVAAGAVGAAWVAAASQTTTGPLGVVPGNFRWLWPTGAFVWLVTGLVIARIVSGGARTGQHRARVAAWAALLVLAAAALVPASNAEILASDEPLIPVARDLLGQLDALDGHDVLVVERGGLFFAEPYTYVVMAGLQDRGIGFQVTEELDVLRFGEGRRDDGTASGRIRLVSGDAALGPFPGEQRVAFATGLSSDERAELARLRGQPPRGAQERARLAELEERWARETVAVVLRPAAG